MRGNSCDNLSLKVCVMFSGKKVVYIILPRCKIGKQLCTVNVPVHGMSNAYIFLIRLISDGICEEIIACAFLSQTLLSSSDRKRASSYKN